MSVEQDANGAEVFDVVHARLLRFFPDLVQELGGDPTALMRQAGIDVTSPPESPSAATYRQAIQLLELAATQLHCPDFGMRLATLQSGRMFGPLGLVMKNSKTFGDALDYVGKHTHAHSLAARIWLKRIPGEKAAFAGHDILLDRSPNKSQAMEQLLLVGHLAAMEITGGQARVRKVYFRHQPVSPLKTYRRYFGCEVCFDQKEDGVIFSERDLASPVVDPDSRIYELATSFIDAEFTRDRPPLRALTRGVIMQFLGTEDCSNERVAAELNLHARTMHRRLTSEGTSFRQIKDEVRRDLMLYYIQHTDLEFAHISERLGFAEQSVMTRTCNRWFAASPTQLRSRRHRLSQAS
ncbi:AraC family transcriptional regulator ligand-binding domain-containing protein [Phenylobacterium sp. LjRoot225]|uniref:AraC family transcriptional regulator n=1 Tax=Phenylobacterium sp. LjRoot225 TaxID=3342285 RepID=UPI003ED127A7